MIAGMDNAIMDLEQRECQTLKCYNSKTYVITYFWQ
jgi:hypothetical protein